MLRLAILILALAMPAKAEEVVAALSQNQISITTNFDGSEILIFGAVNREEAIPDTPLDIIVTVAGPSQAVTVRRKDRRFGIWVNTDSVEVDEAPSFYAVQTSAPFGDAVKDVEDLRHRISVPKAIRLVGAPMAVADAAEFTRALIRIRKDQGLYQVNESAVDVSDSTLFQTRVALPANLVEGQYNTRIFLARQGEIVSLYETAIDVRKVGLERILYALAHERPLIYGLLSLAIAIFAGWGASAAFRVLQR